MYNKMNYDHARPYQVSDISVRFASEADLESLFIVRAIATQQKENKKTNLNPVETLSKFYHSYEADAMIRQWKKDGMQYLLASVPADHVHYKIPDKNDPSQKNTVTGFLGTQYDPQENASTFHLHDLFATRSNYPVGSLLMTHCLHMAKASDAEYIRLNAPFKESRKWYDKIGFQHYTPPGLIGQHFGGYGETEETAGIFNGLSKSAYLLQLHRDNFDQALDILQKPIMASRSRAYSNS